MTSHLADNPQQEVPSAPFPPFTLKAPRIAVLHLIYSVGHGGIESNLINWVRYTDPNRFRVHVAYFAGDRNREAAFLRAAELAGITVLPIPWSRFKPFLKAARAVEQLVRDFDIDILHTHAYYGDVVGALAARLVPVKTLATVYVWGNYELHRQIMQWMDRTAIQFMDKVTAHCYDTARRTPLRFLLKGDMPVLFPGFPDEHQPPSPEERRRLCALAGLEDSQILLLNVARYAQEKAQDQLLHSFLAILDRYPGARLWISGYGLPSVEQGLHQLRRKLGLEEAVSFVGYRENLWPMLDIADFMTHPSHVEGVPIALLYGMAAGLPIVVSDVGGVREIIRHEHTGVLVPENDVERFTGEVMR